MKDQQQKYKPCRPVNTLSPWCFGVGSTRYSMEKREGKYGKTKIMDDPPGFAANFFSQVKADHYYYP